jgi:uncharacterized RDD family membrane protein YckC
VAEYALTSTRSDDLEDRVVIQTPEMVRIVLPLAGLGSRGLAYMVDWSVRYGIPLLVLAILTLLVAPFADLIELSRRYPLVAVGILVTFFLLQTFYYVVFETFWSGQTPGKRLMGLRVVHRRGTPVSFLASTVRNFVRIADWLPSFYGFGIAAVFLSPRNQRLGDLAAGTLIVRERGAEGAAWEGTEAWVAPEWARRIGLVLDTAEWEKVRRFVSRTEELEDEPRRILARRILGEILSARGHDPELPPAEVPPAPVALRQLVHGGSPAGGGPSPEPGS